MLNLLHSGRFPACQHTPCAHPPTHSCHHIERQRCSLERPLWSVRWWLVVAVVVAVVAAAAIGEYHSVPALAPTHPPETPPTPAAAGHAHHIRNMRQLRMYADLRWRWLVVVVVVGGWGGGEDGADGGGEFSGGGRGHNGCHLSPTLPSHPASPAPPPAERTHLLPPRRTRCRASVREDEAPEGGGPAVRPCTSAPAAARPWQLLPERLAFLHRQGGGARKRCGTLELGTLNEACRNSSPSCRSLS